jgi:alkyl hydroperoxide reductase subunit AhpF
VTILEFMPQPKASKILLDRADSNPNIEIKCNANIDTIVGDELVTGVDGQDLATNIKSRLEVGGIFIRI